MISVFYKNKKLLQENVAGNENPLLRFWDLMATHDKNSSTKQGYPNQMKSPKPLIDNTFKAYIFFFIIQNFVVILQSN